jgi:hypothetical protein
MRQLISSLYIFVLSTSLALAYNAYGVCNYGKEILPSVICYGPAILKGTVVMSGIKVAGPLKAVDVMADSLVITGNADLRNTKIKGPTSITGSLQANNVEFQHGLIVSSDSVILNHSKVNGDLSINSQANKPRLILCGTLISGAVTFYGMPGLIQITDDSTVQGKVINGSMEFIKKKC